MQSPLVAVMRANCRAGLSIVESAPLSLYTRFAVGGPARVLADAATESALIEILRAIRENGEPYTVMGGGTNLVASDQGYDGVVLRYTNPALEFAGNTVSVAAGVVLQDLVDAAIARGLGGNRPEGQCAPLAARRALRAGEAWNGLPFVKERGVQGGSPVSVACKPSAV